MGIYWTSPKNSVASLSRDSHVTKISKSNSEGTIAVIAYCDYAYDGLSLWALTGLVEKLSLWRGIGGGAAGLTVTDPLPVIGVATA